MKHKQQLSFAISDRQKLGDTLQHAHLQTSEDLGGATLYYYHDRRDGRDHLAIALPNGKCVIIGHAEPSGERPERRRRSFLTANADTSENKASAD